MNKKRIAITFIATAIFSVLSVVCVECGKAPAGIWENQWRWIGYTGIICFVVISVLIFIEFNKRTLEKAVYYSIVWSLISLGGVEAIYGLLQIYGIAVSNHSLFCITGTFYNPGPYSGYLAMAFPVCLYEYLILKDKKEKKNFEKIGYYITILIMLLILCVLPAAMSRTAWIALIVSFLWVCGIYYNWYKRLIEYQRKRPILILIFTLLAITLLALISMLIFDLKKDSADGRLLRWKISSHAIAKHPLTGYGKGMYSRAYGKAQEHYFETSIFSPQEEKVAGIPDYAFNEYLQTAVELGIPVLVLGLSFIIFCIKVGYSKKRFGICGSVMSLLVFALASYPLQLPPFIICLVFLLIALLINRRCLIIFPLVIGLLGWNCYANNKYDLCKEWNNCKFLYTTKAYSNALEGYKKLYPLMREYPVFLYEYAYCLHKRGKYKESIYLLKEALLIKSDPMINNIIGKNYQLLNQYEEAEKWFIRSTHILPNRIYPYYLLTKLYADPSFYNERKLKQMADIVLHKKEKVKSPAVEKMRNEVKDLLKKITF